MIRQRRRTLGRGLKILMSIEIRIKGTEPKDKTMKIRTKFGIIRMQNIGMEKQTLVKIGGEVMTLIRITRSRTGETEGRDRDQPILKSLREAKHKLIIYKTKK